MAMASNCITCTVINHLIQGGLKVNRFFFLKKNIFSFCLTLCCIKKKCLCFGINVLFFSDMVEKLTFPKILKTILTHSFTALNLIVHTVNLH